MSRRTFYYDKDLDAVVERRGNYFEERKPGPFVHADGMPDTYNPGTGKIYDSKSRYVRETHAKGMHIIEKGEPLDGSGQRQATEAALGTSRERGRDIKDAIDKLKSGTNLEQLRSKLNARR